MIRTFHCPSSRTSTTAIGSPPRKRSPSKVDSTRATASRSLPRSSTAPACAFIGIHEVGRVHSASCDDLRDATAWSPCRIAGHVGNHCPSRRGFGFVSSAPIPKAGDPAARFRGRSQEQLDGLAAIRLMITIRAPEKRIACEKSWHEALSVRAVRRSEPTQRNLPAFSSSRIVPARFVGQISSGSRCDASACCQRRENRPAPCARCAASGRSQTRAGAVPGGETRPDRTRLRGAVIIDEPDRQVRLGLAGSDRRRLRVERPGLASLGGFTSARPAMVQNRSPGHSPPAHRRSIHRAEARSTAGWNRCATGRPGAPSRSVCSLTQTYLRLRSTTSASVNVRALEHAAPDASRPGEIDQDSPLVGQWPRSWPCSRESRNRIGSTGLGPDRLVFEPVGERHGLGRSPFPGRRHRTRLNQTHRRFQQRFPARCSDLKENIAGTLPQRVGHCRRPSCIVRAQPCECQRQPSDRLPDCGQLLVSGLRPRFPDGTPALRLGLAGGVTGG